MLTITSLDKQTTLPLIDTGQPERLRDIDGTHTLYLTVRETDINSRAFKLIENEATLTLDGDKYIIKNVEPSIIGESVQYEIEAVHQFTHDLAGNWVYDIIPSRKVLSLHQALSHILPSGYTFIIHDDFDNKSYEDFGGESSLALFERIRVDYNFEFVKDDKHIKIYKQIGNKTAKQMRYKHNIISISGGLNSIGLATYIEGYGKQVEDEEGNLIEGEYLAQATYTSPLADAYGIIHAPPIKDERFHNKSELLEYMKSKLHDTIDISYDIEYDEFIKALDDDTEVELGDEIYLIHEPLNENFNTRIVAIKDFPLSNNLKPIYTISSKKESLVDRQVQANTEKKNNDKDIAKIKNNQSNHNKAMEKLNEELAELDNELKHLDDEMDYLQNEVLPEVEQAVENTKIPSQPEPPIPTNSNLWWDTSINPPRLKRWTGTEWVILAPSEDEIDALMQQMRDEAILEGKAYSDAEIQAARQAIINQLDKEIGDVNSSITDLNDIKDDLVNRVDTAESNIESNETAINQLSNEIELRVTKEEFENGMANISTVNLISSLPGAWEQGDYNESGDKIENNSTNKVRLETGNASMLQTNTEYTFSSEGLSNYTSMGIEVYISVIRLEYATLTDLTIERLVDRQLMSEPITFNSGSRTFLESSGIDRDSSYVVFVIELEDSLIIDHDELDQFKLMLNKGTTAQPYQPHSPDIIERISNSEATLNIHSEALELKAEKSELVNYVDKQVYNNKIGELDVAIDNITGRVESTEVDFNDFKTGDYNTFKQQYGEFKLEMDNFTTKVGELSDIDGTLVDSFSEVKQEVGLIETTVQDVRVELDDLEIGGVNMLTILKENWEQGGISSTTGEPSVTSVAWIRTKEFTSIEGGRVVTVSSSNYYNVYLHFYDSDKDYIGLQQTGYGEEITFTLNPEVSFFKVAVRNRDGSNMDLEILGQELKIQVEYGNKSTSWRSSPSDDNSRMTAIETKIVQLPDEINLIVQEGIDLIDVGSRRNLLPNSRGDDLTDWVKWQSATTMVLYESTSFAPGKQWIRAIKGDANTFGVQTPTFDLVANKTYTISFTIRSLSNSGYNLNYIYIRSGKSSLETVKSLPNVAMNNPIFEGNIAGDGLRVWFTFKHDEDIEDARILLGLIDRPDNAGFIIREVKIEESVKPSPWSPAPEDQVNKTNVLSSINLSTEGVKIEGAKIDIVGLVSVLNADGTAGTMIDGGKIVAKSITANELNVNNIFGNSAVIAKIQADSVKTAKLDASKITTGEMSGARIQTGTLSATKITSGNLDASKVNVLNLNASNIKTGTLNAIDITGSNIYGGTLNALNNNTTFNLNSGNLGMENADFTLGGGAMIKFTNTGNRVQFSELREGVTRYSGLGVGRGTSAYPYPIAYVGTSSLTGGVLDNTSDNWTGLTVHSQKSLTDGAYSSITSNKFMVRDSVIYSRALIFDLTGNTPSIRTNNPTDYDYELGTLRRVYGKQSLSFTNYYNERSGWLMETTYAGDGTDITFRGAYGSDYNYQIGSSSTNNRIRNIYLRNNPNVSSDERLKTDIDDLDLDLALDLLKITSKRFKMKLTNADLQGGIRGQNPYTFGFIAQEVEQVLIDNDKDLRFESLVTTGEDGYKAMEYSQMIAVHHRLLQNAYKKNEELENRLDKMEKQLEQLLA